MARRKNVPAPAPAPAAPKAQEMGSGVIRIAGRSFTRGNALARGLIVSKHDLTLTAAGLDVAGRIAISNPGVTVPPKARTKTLDVEKAAGAEFTSDGRQRRKRIEPLKPKNIDHEGNEIQDQETLDRIAAADRGHRGRGGRCPGVRRWVTGTSLRRGRRASTRIRCLASRESSEGPARARLAGKNLRRRRSIQDGPPYRMKPALGPPSRPRRRSAGSAPTAGGVNSHWRRSAALIGRD